MKRLFILVYTLAFTAGAVWAQHSEIWRNVSYADDTLTGHRMDISLPEKGEEPYPVVVVIAGSVWFGNDTKERAYLVMDIPLLEATYHPDFIRKTDRHIDSA